MSVVGIDLGNSRSKVAIARHIGGDIAIQIAFNNMSNKETPSLVSFSGDERFVGECAMTQVESNGKNTVGTLMKLVGQKCNSDSVRKIAAATPLNLVAGPDDRVLVEVMYESTTQRFAPEHLLAMLLSDLCKTAENELKTPVVNCVLAVPSHFRVAERQAILDSAKIVGMNVLHLINSTTAAALQWGYNSALQHDGQIVCLCDCGESTFDVAIVQFSKDKLKVLGKASSTLPSGVSLDTTLANHLARVFHSQCRIDLLARPCLKVRLLQTAESAKRVLSSSNHRFDIQFQMDDIDMSAKVTREEFEEMCMPHMDQISVCIAQALAVAGVTADMVQCVELIGGCSSIPMVAQAVRAAFNGRAVSHTLSASACVAQGACLQCAMLSHTPTVRQYVIEDVCHFGVEATWPIPIPVSFTMTLFGPNEKFPGRKVLTLLRYDPFEITLKYSDSGEVISRSRVSGMKNQATLQAAMRTNAQQGDSMHSVPPSPEPNKIKVTFELTPSGIVSIEGAVVHEDFEVQDLVLNEEATALALESHTDAWEVFENVWTKKTRMVAIACESLQSARLSVAQLAGIIHVESQLAIRDREIKERLVAKHSLESYVYDTLARLEEPAPMHMTEAERVRFLGILRTTEDWLFSGPGSKATRAVYVERLSQLQRVVRA